MVIGQAFADEFLTRVTDGWLGGESDLSRIQDSIVSDDSLLRFIMAEWFLTEK